MTTSFVSNSTAATFGNSPQKTGEPLDHAKLFSGKALEFDGVGDYLTSPYYHTSEDEITVSFWFYKNDSDTGHNYVVGMGGRSNAAHTACYITSGVIYWRVGNALTSSTGIDLRDGVWHRIVLTYDESNAKIYVDGVLNNSASVTGDLIVNGSSHRIGYSTGGDNIFTGSLCDYQVWNKVWELSDVQYDYNNPETLITGNASVTSGFTTSNLKLWYPMNDTGSTNPQTVIFDAAGTNNTTKNHATTTFFGDMTDLIADDASNGANLYNTANTLFDFTAESAAHSGGDGYDILANSLWTGTNATAKIETDNSDQGMEIKNTGSSPGNIKSGAITTVSGRTYQLDITHTDNDVNAWATADLGIYAGTSDGGSQYINISDQSDGSYSGTFVATGVELHLTLVVVSATLGHAVRIKTIQLREVGIASGWTDAHQVETIPQTALMNGSSKLFFNGDDSYIECGSDSSLDDIFNGGGTISVWVFSNNTASNPYFLNKTGVGNDGWFFGVDGTSMIRFTVVRSGTNAKAEKASALSSDVWTHYAITYDDVEGNSPLLYKNGALISDATVVAGGGTYDSDASLNFEIGRKTTSDQGNWRGFIDEISAFDTILTASQIEALYNSGTPLNATKSAAAANLQGYWRNNALESTGKWEDLSSNTNHGTVNNLSDTIFFQEGITTNKDSQGFANNIDHTGSKGAVYFDGVADYIDLGKTTTIEGEFALEFWLKTDDLSANTIMGTGADDKLIITDNNTLTLEMSGTDEVIDINDVGNHATDTLLINEWVHIVITREEDNELKLYVNSQIQSDAAETSTAGFDYRYIGFDGESTYFKGWLDEFKVYDKKLTSGQVLKNYNHGKSKHKNS